MSEQKLYLTMTESDLKHLMKAAVKGSDPNYSLFEDPLIKRAGSYTGGFSDEWRWNDLNEFTLDELQEIYLKCKIAG